VAIRSPSFAGEAPADGAEVAANKRDVVFDVDDGRAGLLFEAVGGDIWLCVVEQERVHPELIEREIVDRDDCFSHVALTLVFVRDPKAPVVRVRVWHQADRSNQQVIRWFSQRDRPFVLLAADGFWQRRRKVILGTVFWVGPANGRIQVLQNFHVCEEILNAIGVAHFERA